MEAKRPPSLDVLAKGRNLEADHRLADALELYEAELALPGEPDVHSSLLRAIGRVRLRQADFAGAEAALARAVALTPDDALALTSWGCTLQLLSRHVEAERVQRRAVALDPDCDPARINLAVSLLLQGQYAEAWPHYEARLREQLLIRTPEWLPRWDGSCYVPELIVVAEQGIGDLIQFCRYVPLLQLVTPVVSLVSERKLHSLLQRSGLFHRLYAMDRPFDPEPGAQWLPLMALPELMSLTSEHVMLDGPYLEADPEQVREWAALFGPAQGLRVGIGWQGNPSSEVEGHTGRSLPLELLAPLAELEGVELVSLQKGPGMEQLATCSFRDRFSPLQPEVDRTWDFLETLAILQLCDLVISSDTALAHLAGAMGRPTWILLKAVPDWRWGLEGDTTPWYPSARLFRQRTMGDWPEVVGRMVQKLQDDEQYSRHRNR